MIRKKLPSQTKKRSLAFANVPIPHRVKPHVHRLQYPDDDVPWEWPPDKDIEETEGGSPIFRD